MDYNGAWNIKEKCKAFLTTDYHPADWLFLPHGGATLNLVLVPSEMIGTMYKPVGQGLT